MRRAIRLSLALGGCLACEQAPLQEPPEASVDACTARVVVFCDAGPTDAAACSSDLGDAAPSLPEASYPVGCTANVIGTMRDPNTGVCALAATCTCQSGDASAAWVCAP